MKSTYSNMALEIIANNPDLNTDIKEIIYRVSGSIDSDLETLEAKTNDSGFVGVDPVSSTYRLAIEKLQLFSGLFKETEPVQNLFDEMRSAVFTYKSKV